MTSDPPFSGYVAKVDPFNTNERALFRGRDPVEAIQIKFSDSHWLFTNPVDELVGPNQQLILVDWEDEDHLMDRHPDDIIRHCLELEPYLDHVYLGDRWTYEKMGPRRNRTQINRSVGVQEELGRQFRKFDVNFEFHPMVQGWKSWHLERVRPVVEEFGKTMVGFDATGYNSKYDLADDVNRAIRVLDLESLYVSGRIGPTYLEILPKEVQAVSGRQSLMDDVKSPTGEHNPSLLDPEIKRRLNALNNDQAQLRQFEFITT